MDAGTLQKLNDILTKGMEASIEGDIMKRFRALKSVFLASQFKIENLEDKQEIKDKIKEISGLFKQRPSTINRQQAAQYFSLQIDTIEDKVDELDLRLNELLYEADVIHLKQRKHPSMEAEIEADYE